MKITDLKDPALADRCPKTAWHAIEYTDEKHRGRALLGVGMPYNSALISL